MGFDALALAFAAAVALHNAEEALFLPSWSKTAGRWHVPVGAREFRFAVATLTGLAFSLAVWANAGSVAGAYLVSGYGLAMALNSVAPHLAATLALRRYAPGTATALLLNLPISLALIRAGLLEGRIEWSRFLWAGPLTVAGLLASIPALFALGRTLLPARAL
jgi:hypothetical protein